MPRQLIAFVDSVTEGNEPGAVRGPFARWPALESAQQGGFDHVVLIASPRFRWDEILAGPDDRLLPDAIAEVEPARATEAPPAASESSHAEAAAPAEGSEEEHAPGPEETPANAGIPSGEAAPVAPVATPEEAAAEPAAEASRDETPEAGSEDSSRKARSAGAREPRRAPPRTLGELRARLQHMAQGGRPDRGAIEQLGAELARALAIPSVACRVIPPFARDREQVGFIRSVLGLLRPQLPAVLEFAEGPRSTAGLGLVLAHGIHALRPDVPIAELTTDRTRNLGVHPRSLLHAIEIQDMWKGAAAGAPSPALLDHMRNDSRLQALVAPYQRLVRALEFGSPSEATRAAKSVRERLASPERGREREDWAAVVRPVVSGLAEALASDRPWSARQLWMAEASEKRGTHFMTALHLREAMISGLLEAYGHNAAKGWAAVGEDAQADARIRPREVMAVVLSDPESARLVPDLGQVWQWVGSPRAKFVMTSPIALDPALLRDGNRALMTIVPLTRAILEEGRLKAIVEALPYEQAIELAIGQKAVRVAPLRGRRGPRRGPEREGDSLPEEAAPAPAPSDAEGAVVAPFAPRPGVARERRRPPQGEPRRTDRPREVAAHRRHDGPGRGPRPPSDPSAPVTSIPIGGVIKVERAAHGLGNLGLALRNAGVNPAPRGRKEKPGPPAGPDTGSPAGEAKRPEAAEIAAPLPPSPEVSEAPARPEPPPPTPDFDVAGPLPSAPPA